MSIVGKVLCAAGNACMSVAGAACKNTREATYAICYTSGLALTTASILSILNTHASRMLQQQTHWWGSNPTPYLGEFTKLVTPVIVPAVNAAATALELERDPNLFVGTALAVGLCFILFANFIRPPRLEDIVNERQLKLVQGLAQSTKEDLWTINIRAANAKTNLQGLREQVDAIVAQLAAAQKTTPAFNLTT